MGGANPDEIQSTLRLAGELFVSGEDNSVSSDEESSEEEESFTSDFARTKSGKALSVLRFLEFGSCQSLGSFHLYTTARNDDGLCRNPL
ncbi:unnamed protein product [Allacma fusca]|uniref:Uncharacterized protein n=1 Tax=Allacma fusca TaxID=39272 RepID=A0A8J2KBE8_9HEXA|nr:unnamed protein product [Allacma fusca]